MTIKGKVFKLFDLNRVSDTFRKREFVLEYADNPEYPQHVIMQATQNKVSILDSLKEGDVIEVDFNLRGREWIAPSGEKKYFNSLDAWKVTIVEKGDDLDLNGDLPAF